MELLKMKNIEKSFGEVLVLKGVEITIESGEVHALLGENGAGKSTLMNILAGVYPKDKGSIWFNGEEYKHMTVRDTMSMGIAFVHQELNLFNDLKVYENIFLTNEYKNSFGWLDKKRMINETKKLFEKMGVLIDAEEKVEDLKTSEKQLLEIAKALFFDAKLLIRDEPTTSLNNQEIENLFGIIHKLKERGTAFIFISHKMPEIFALADRYTVLRNGEYIRSGKISETTPEQITSMMVGTNYSSKGNYRERKTGETILKLSDFTGEGFSHVNLDVKKGQIIGITGLQGSGSSEILQGIFGAGHVIGGDIEVSGIRVEPNSIHRSMRAGIAMLAANRKENSVIADMSILENMYLAEHTLSAWRFYIRKRDEQAKFLRYKNLLNIKVRMSEDGITFLSGGNQQKVFLARWLNTDAKILLLDNPTQGIDVGAKTEIYKLIIELAEQGKTVLINTLEIPEIRKVADYCVVFYGGSIIKILPHKDIDEQTVMLYSTNAVTV